MENSDKALDRGAKRVYDVAPSAAFAEFMSTGWAKCGQKESGLFS